MSVIVDQLRISDNGKNLYINAHVNKAAYFDSMYIESITICTEDQVSELNPASIGEHHVYMETFGPGTREINLVLCSQMFNELLKDCDFTKHMLFVYITCGGAPTPDTPCTMDEMTTLAVTFDYGLLYNKGMGFTRELADTCSIPREFIDYILNVEALKLSLETEHYVPAINYWKELMGRTAFSTYNSTTPRTKPCGCYG